MRDIKLPIEFPAQPRSTLPVTAIHDAQCKASYCVQKVPHPGLIRADLAPDFTSRVRIGVDIDIQFASTERVYKTHEITCERTG